MRKSVVPLFANAVDIVLPARRQVAVRVFSMHMDNKITRWSQEGLDFADWQILGGRPNHKAVQPLAEQIFVFLENHQKAEGSLVDQLLDETRSKKVLYDPAYHLFGMTGDFTRSTKILMTWTLGKILAEKNDRYTSLKTEAVFQDIADKLYGQNKELVYYLTGLGEQHDGFIDEMASLAKKVTGCLPEPIAGYFEERCRQGSLELPISGGISANMKHPNTKFFPANDWI